MMSDAVAPQGHDGAMQSTAALLRRVDELLTMPQLAGRPAWQRHANCMGVDPDLFYPGRGDALAPAKAVCRSCVVRADCLEYALANGEKFGVWGGMSERERRRVRHRRRLASVGADR